VYAKMTAHLHKMYEIQLLQSVLPLYHYSIYCNCVLVESGQDLWNNCVACASNHISAYRLWMFYIDIMDVLCRVCTNDR